MSKIITITAADEKFKELCTVCAESAKYLGYETLVYDLGNLGFGIPFKARFADDVGGKIPSKPNIILDALSKVNDGDYVVWLDADTIMWETIDEIKGNFDIGVTVRVGKQMETDNPINAGVCFFKKTSATLNFIDLWISKCEQGTSDQRELNKLLKGVHHTHADNNEIISINGLLVKVFSVKIYNSWAFKKPQSEFAKITHYKSKYRRFWPTRTINYNHKNYQTLEENRSTSNE